jgi:hypothetical protein
VLVFRSGLLYHGVTTWKPAEDDVEAVTTVGRVAFVFFTHQNTLEVMEQWPKGYFQEKVRGNPKMWTQPARRVPRQKEAGEGQKRKRVEEEPQQEHQYTLRPRLAM